MEAVNITEASSRLGYKSRTVLNRFISNGWLNDFLVVNKLGKKRLKMEGLKEHVESLIQPRSTSIQFRQKPDIDLDTWLRMGEAANAVCQEMGWVISSPKTAAEWSLIYEAMEKAREESVT